MMLDDGRVFQTVLLILEGGRRFVMQTDINKLGVCL